MQFKKKQFLSYIGDCTNCELATKLFLVGHQVAILWFFLNILPCFLGGTNINLQQIGLDSIRWTRYLDREATLGNKSLKDVIRATGMF